MSRPIESDKDLKKREKLRLMRVNKADSVDWKIIEHSKSLVKKGIQKTL